MTEARRAAPSQNAYGLNCNSKAKLSAHVFAECGWPKQFIIVLAGCPGLWRARRLGNGASTRQLKTV